MRNEKRETRNEKWETRLDVGLDSRLFYLNFIIWMNDKKTASLGESHFECDKLELQKVDLHSDSKGFT